MILLLAAAIGGFAAGFFAAALADGMVTGGMERHYWIVAEEVEWDYAPSYPTNLMTGDAFNEDHDVDVGDESGVIGRIYTKSVYREYSKDFKTRLDHEEHLGILGPSIRAEVGDTIVVHFRNDTSHDTSVHLHGVHYSWQQGQ